MTDVALLCNIMRVLVTGGAGFIGSNIVDALLKREDVTQVIVLDNFSTGFEKNIMSYLKHSKFNFIFGDITDCKTCKDACALADVVCHQLAEPRRANGESIDIGPVQR